MKIRKQVYIDERHEKLLKERARQLGTTEADLIRQALDHTLLELGGLVNKAAFERFLGYAAERDKLALEPRERTWRRDDLYDV